MFAKYIVFSLSTLWCAFKVSVVIWQPMTGRMGLECGPSSQPSSAECGQEEREGEGVGQCQPEMHLGEEEQGKGCVAHAADCGQQSI